MKQLATTLRMPSVDSIPESNYPGTTEEYQKLCQNEEAIAATRDLIEALKKKYNNQPITSESISTVTTLKRLEYILLYRHESKQNIQAQTQMIPQIT